MRNVRMLAGLLTMLVVGAAGGCAPPRPAPDAIAPAATRGTNADLAADLRTMDAWEARRAALVRADALLGPGSARGSELGSAGAWLAFARDAYVAARRSPAADEAFAEARRIIEKNEQVEHTSLMASAPKAVAPAVHSSAAVARFPQLSSRARALDDRGSAVRALVAQAEVELARAAVAGERDSVAMAIELASRGSELPAGAIPMQLVSSAKGRAGTSAASCPLTPHLARARELLAQAESRVRQQVIAAAADSAARARLAFLAGVRADDRVRTRAVHFALDKDTLGTASRALLDRVSAALKEHSGLVVVLEGHTDPRGGVAYNLDLSRRRGAAVRNYLERTGLDVSRIEVKGFGLAARRTNLSTREAYALDRRVLVRFSMEDGTPLAETDELLDLQVEQARRVVRAGMKGTPKVAPKSSPKAVTKATTRRAR